MDEPDVNQATEYQQPRHCTCLFTKEGTFDARVAVGFEYTSRPPSIRDPFCTYNHVRDRDAA